MSMCMGHRASDNRYCLLQMNHAGDCEFDRRWVPVRWNELTADTEDGQPVGDTIRLEWPDGTVVIGRLTVPSYGSGHHQVLRMQTVVGGDTYVWPHGSTLSKRETS